MKIIAEKPALHRLFFQALLKKMTSSSRGFPWRSASVLLLLLIGAIVAYDTQKHGSFEGKSFLQSVTLNHSACFLLHISLSSYVVIPLYVFLNSFHFVLYSSYNSTILS